jgi:16S rRNA (guanine527-N7)-methyltransferase
MTFSISTKEKLEKYCSNIIKWNRAYNLLSNSQNESEIWDRHILDSMQIYEYFPDSAKVIVDFGSGAGLPAIPVAVVSTEKNDGKKFILLESTTKKSLFLENTARLLQLKNVEVKCERIEKIKDIKADVITARAFAKISEIFEISKNYIHEDTKFVLLKGKNIEEEIALANGNFTYEYQIINSKTGDGFIFLAENVKHK